MLAKRLMQAQPSHIIGRSDDRRRWLRDRLVLPPANRKAAHVPDREDSAGKPAEFTPWVATPARSQPELRERLIGDQVRQARRSAGLTQLELARTLRIALSKLSRYERGLDTMPPRLLLTSIILGLAVGRKALQGGLRSSQRLN
jgi:hypothetical protein